MIVWKLLILFFILISPCFAEEIYLPITVDEKPQNVELKEVGTEWKFVLKNGEFLNCYLIVATTDPVIKFRFKRPSTFTNILNLNLYFNAHPAKVIQIYLVDKNVDVTTDDADILDRSKETNYNMYFNGNRTFGIENGKKIGTLGHALETKDWNGKKYVPFRVSLTGNDESAQFELFFKKGTIAFDASLQPAKPSPPATDKATAGIIGGVCGGIGIIVVATTGIIGGVCGGIGILAVVGAIAGGIYCYRKKKAPKPKHEIQDEMHTAIRMPDEKKAGEIVMESTKGESTTDKKEPKKIEVEIPKETKNVEKMPEKENLVPKKVEKSLIPNITQETTEMFNRKNEMGIANGYEPIGRLENVVPIPTLQRTQETAETPRTAVPTNTTQAGSDPTQARTVGTDGTQARTQISAQGHTGSSAHPVKSEYETCKDKMDK
uniref:Allorecognition 2 n=1 Tax=Panagrolaimus sp. JU765 TaxID=591449 RepID=A0AC34RLU4_9BILA